MKEKWENLFKNKKTENLIFFLVVLIVTLIIINQILKEDSSKDTTNNINNTAVLANSEEEINTKNTNLSKDLEEILKKIEGVGNVSVLITYSESEIKKVPMYNENNSQNNTEEVDKDGTNKKTTSDTFQKEVVLGADQNPVIQTIENPKIEGAIITAEGAGNIEVKSNIVSAVEAATGIATHKIQVFEMKK